MVQMKTMTRKHSMAHMVEAKESQVKDEVNEIVNAPSSAVSASTVISLDIVSKTII